MRHSLHTFGYSGRSPDELQDLAERLDALVVDIRFSPRSRNPDWSGGRLRKRLGGRYHHLPALGNRNYQGGPIAFADLEAGVAAAGDLLEQRAVILLCVCGELRRCHRLLAAEAIAAQYGVLIKHH